MHRVLISVFLLALAACTSAPVQQESQPVTDRPAAAPVDVGVDWGWKIIGDAAVRPTQVFSLNGKTYLQMRRDQYDVVLIADGVIANHKLYPPYLVVMGAPNQIDVVRDGYRATVLRSAGRVQDDDRVTRVPEAATVRESRGASTSSRVIRVLE